VNSAAYTLNGYALIEYAVDGFVGGAAVAVLEIGGAAVDIAVEGLKTGGVEVGK
jgi:hypothetical protein